MEIGVEKCIGEYFRHLRSKFHDIFLSNEAAKDLRVSSIGATSIYEHFVSNISC